MPQFRWLAIGFNPSAVHVGFMLHKAALEQGFLREGLRRLALSQIIPQNATFIHLPPMERTEAPDGPQFNT